MFLKLLAVVLCAAGVAAALLVVRQQRIETAHDLVDVHRRLQTRERALWSLQNEVAQRCGPDALRRLMDPLETEWRPIVPGAAPDGVALPVVRGPDPDDESVLAARDPEAPGG